MYLVMHDFYAAHSTGSWRTLSRSSGFVLLRLMLGNVMPEIFQKTGVADGSNTKFASSSDKTISVGFVS